MNFMFLCRFSKLRQTFPRNCFRPKQPPTNRFPFQNAVRCSEQYWPITEPCVKCSARSPLNMESPSHLGYILIRKFTSILLEVNPTRQIACVHFAIDPWQRPWERSYQGAGPPFADATIIMKCNHLHRAVRPDLQSITWSLFAWPGDAGDRNTVFCGEKYPGKALHPPMYIWH